MKHNAEASFLITDIHMGVVILRGRGVLTMRTFGLSLVPFFFERELFIWCSGPNKTTKEATTAADI